VSAENRLIALFRGIATHPAARGLADDAAVLELGKHRLVLTHDMIVEGVHFLPSDPPESVAWKLLAVNLSDLAAKGATPLGVLMGFTLGDDDWDAAFVKGLGAACDHFAVPLLGGDTVSAPDGNARTLGLTAIGEALGPVPSRSGAREGDALFVTGTIGDAGLGLKMAQDELETVATLLNAYHRPMPLIAAGTALSGSVTAIMDVSDGLLIDAARLAEASGCAALIDLDVVPLSPDLRRIAGETRMARLAAATAGDDYQLLFTANRPIPSLPCPVTRIGQMIRGSGVHLHDSAGAVPLPAKLGWLHGLP
jgi:thiamine-monophosphate kinase